MLLIGIEGTALRTAEAQWLRHPGVVGVVLFRRNYAEPEQLRELVSELRGAAGAPLLVAVDQEGGRVQRFIEGFARLPALARIGEVYRLQPQQGLQLAAAHAQLMAAELRALDIDLSFAPVVDLGRGNRAIGDRAFAAEVEQVCALTAAYVQAMAAAGMAATLKHFPGHGSVLEDTHVDLAVDPRPAAQIEAEDLAPFRAGIAAGAAAVMMAHVVYPAVCEQPAGYSKVWIDDWLRVRMGFRGAVLSDDIGMAAARTAGGVAARVHAHLQAGCDAVLACHPELVDAALAALDISNASEVWQRLAVLQGRVGQGAAPALLAQARANLAALV
jgi:beta-N-acetylhexosaminidase